MGHLEVDDRVAGDRLDRRVDVAGDREGDAASVVSSVADARDSSPSVGRVHRLGELDRDPAWRPAQQVGHPLHRDQPAVADDPDPVADALDLVELV